MQIPEQKVDEEAKAITSIKREPKSKTVEVQTIFRESETQTDPFAPQLTTESKIRKPEVLLLEKFNYGTLLF